MTRHINTSPGLRRPITVSDQQLAERCARGRVVLIDDDPEILAALASLLEMEGYACEVYASAVQYLQTLAFSRPQFPGPYCVLCDVKMPVLDGLELQRRLLDLGDMPLLLMSGKSGAYETVRAFRAGALDFLIKPIEADDLLVAVQRALAASREHQIRQVKSAETDARIASLTEREREVARRVARGQTNPAIAAELDIGLRTVKLHRQHAMEKLGLATAIDLARLVDQGNL